MSGNYGAGITVKTSKNGESGNGTNHEENPMAGGYPGNFGNPPINAKGKAELQRKDDEQEFLNNETEMNDMLNKALANKVLFFNLEKYKTLINRDLYYRYRLKKPKRKYFYPESFGTRLYKRCIGGNCESVEVPVPPPKPAYYRKRKQTKVNTRKSNTRKSNTRKSNTRKRSNF